MPIHPGIPGHRRPGLAVGATARYRGPLRVPARPVRRAVRARALLEHSPTLDEDPGPLRAVYGLARFKDGGSTSVVLRKAEVDAHRARSKSSGRGPWVTDYEAMARKTAIRAMMPFLPLSAEVFEQVSVDEAVVRSVPLDFRDAIDVELEAAPESAGPPEPRRRGRPRKPRDAAAAADRPSPVAAAPDVSAGGARPPDPRPDPSGPAGGESGGDSAGGWGWRAW